VKFSPMLPLFPEEPAPALPPRSAPVARVEFTGPCDRRALVITESLLAFIAWREEHCTEYGRGIWLLDESGLKAYNGERFEVVRL
jgi:hypothetical protein